MKSFQLNGQRGRHELKHEMTKLDAYLLREKLKHYMTPDPHANERGTYLIRSIYFDNFDNKVLMQKKEGLLDRDKFRVRLYNYQNDCLHLEKKSKRNNLTYKQKCRITTHEYEQIQRGEIAWMESDSRSLLQDLYVQMRLQQIRPLTVVDYEREVYIYEYGNVRVTFDSDIKTSFYNHDVLNPDLAMVATNSEIVVLEVKYDEFLPEVIKHLLQLDGRRRGTYSKYQLSRMYG